MLGLESRFKSGPLSRLPRGNPSQLAQNKFRHQYLQSVLQFDFTGSKNVRELAAGRRKWLEPVRESGLILNRE